MEKLNIVTALAASFFAFSVNATMVFNDADFEFGASKHNALENVVQRFQNGLACKPVFGEYNPEHVDDSLLENLVHEAITHEEKRKPIRRLDSIVGQFDLFNPNTLVGLQAQAGTMGDSLGLRNSYIMTDSLVQNMTFLDEVSKPAETSFTKTRSKFENPRNSGKRNEPFKIKNSPFQASFAFFKRLESKKTS